LDDWESIIYVLCWLGTFGANTDDEEDVQAGGKPLRIYKWRTGDAADVAEAKRIDMDTNKLFASNIVSQFIKNPSYVHLKKLVVDLRQKLFDNLKVSPKGRGTLEADEDLFDYFSPVPEPVNSSEPPEKEPYWDDGCDENEFDQFKRRATCAGKISDALLEAIKVAHEATSQRSKRTASSNISITGQVRSLSLNPEHTSQSTPQKSRSSHASTKSNITRSARDIRDERKKEAEYCVRHNLVPDALVAEVAKPRDDGLAAFTAQVATRVCESLEAFIHADEHSKKYAELVKWTGMKEQSPESAMYSPISAFFTYVSKAIDSVHVGIPDGGSYSRACVILPYDITDRNPIGADDDTRIDIALRFASRNASDAELAQRYPGKPDYKDITAIVEVKREVGKEAEALKQLYIYNRNLYAKQTNRRFTWGFTICGSVVHACVFGNDDMFVSKPMDVMEPNGRKELVALLVNMAYCEEDQLGYDPTIRLYEDGGVKEIDVYDQESRKTHTYQCIGPIMLATRNFGRHTRCFLCVDCRDKSGEKKVVVKDAWAYATRKKDGNNTVDVRDEVVIMQKIRDKLAGNKELEGKCATLVHGGVVQIIKGDIVEEDNTDTAFGMLLPPSLSSEKREFRAHRRMAMTPDCVPLQNVDHVDQLIVAAADIMNVHTAIAKTCNILHRDISVNNMLITKLPENKVRGVLIDFDCAKDISKVDCKTRPERTGTYPYMRINNMEISSVKHTQLDDWESLIYVLCWPGTTGINQDDEKLFDRADGLPIEDWQGISPEKVATSKRDKLQTPDSFVTNMLAKFLKLPGYSRLRALVGVLYMKMFFNESYSSFFHGTITKAKPLLVEEEHSDEETSSPDSPVDQDEEQDDDARNPFKRRADYAENIADDLLKTLLKEREKALGRIRKRYKKEMEAPF
ncbi:hypothetical protein EV179_006422, partial [Coemansia sp. RSA 487]